MCRMFTQSFLSVDQTLYLLPLAYLALLFGAYVTFRIFVRNSYLNHGRITAFPLLLEILVCALYCNFPYLYLPFKWPELPILPEQLLLRIPGMSLVSLGIVIILIGMGSLGFRRLFGLGSPAINKSGLYGICRNPQIVGFFIYAL
jgi:protein-S-isoprenylcysteine O-methyltransferase Ste14